MGKHAFSSKPRHVTPQINRLRKMRPVLRVSTQIYGVGQEIDGENIHFQVNPGMWPLKSIISEKWALFGWLQHTFLAFLRRKMENIHFSSKPRYVTPQMDHLRKMNPGAEGFNRHIWRFKEIDGKIFIFQVNLGMWPLKSIVSQKQALWWGFQHIFMAFLRR